MSGGPHRPDPGHDLLEVVLGTAQDVFRLRRTGQAAAKALGLSTAGSARLVTVLSEIGQSLLGADGLTAALRVEHPGAAPAPGIGHPGTAPAPRPGGTTDALLVVRLRWHGDRRLEPGLVSAATRLLDVCRYAPGEGPAPEDTRAAAPTGHGGAPAGQGGATSVTLAQRLPATDAPLAERAEDARGALHRTDDVDMVEALRTQNQQLLLSLEESKQQQEELQRLNQELEETNSGVVALYSELAQELEKTNSGVVALYAELEDKTRQLRVAGEASTRFWANVSHELRSPANSVISLARLLLDPGAEPLSAEQSRQVSLIAASGSTLLALVEELLDVAKAESGRLDPLLVPTDLTTLLHQLHGTLLGTARPGVVLAVPAVPPGLHLVTDEVMLTRVLRNILSNGLKFTDHGEVRLTVDTEDRDGETWFRFTVRDTGVGIPADQLERIFEEFYQVRGPHQRGRSGTGLGLPYARKLTELLGGRLALTSRPGEGTAVTVELPAQTRLPGPGPDAPAPAGLLLDSLVVIDDDRAFLTAVRPTLERIAPYVTEISEIHDAASVLETVKAAAAQAVLLDLMMPVLDGYQVLQQLAADPETARLPVVVLTASDPADIDRTRLAHARAVLGKTHLTPARITAALARRAPATEGTPRFPAQETDTA
ncbi:ATP-binding protein [Streptomyces sp. NPDC088745]|uniref:ATP-binding protein n=1 Tax=Streptomyces sp. NPDC088745 TaxID=3365884 RepID=UPI003821808C